MEGRILSGVGARRLPLGGISGFIEMGERADISIENVGFDAGDAYVFSLAKEISSDGAARWLTDEKARYDAAYKVTSVEGFARALGERLAAEVGPVTANWGDVTYYDEETPDWGCFQNIEFCKPSRLSWQVEFRIVFRPVMPSGVIELSSLILEVPSLRRFVSPRALPRG